MEQFARRTGRGTVQSWCRPCKNAYDRDWYQRNKTAHKQEVARRRRREVLRLRALVAALKANPCTDCGGTFPPYVMDFDHVRDHKVGSIGRLVVNGQEGLLRAELQKCELVCANCHRSRTHRRGYGSPSRRAPTDANSRDEPPPASSDGRQGRLAFEAAVAYRPGRSADRGGSPGDRTPNNRFKRPVLCQLS